MFFLFLFLCEKFFFYVIFMKFSFIFLKNFFYFYFCVKNFFWNRFLFFENLFLKIFLWNFIFFMKIFLKFMKSVCKFVKKFFFIDFLLFFGVKTWKIWIFVYIIDFIFLLLTFILSILKSCFWKFPKFWPFLTFFSNFSP